MIGTLVYLIKFAIVTWLVYAVAVFYGTVTLFSVIVKWIKQGNKLWYIKERTLPPLCLQNPKLGTHSFVKIKDLKIHYVEKGDRSKPLMLFLHGFPEFWFTWRNQLEFFSENYWVVAIDMRGYGDSDKPRKRTDYKMEALAADVGEVVKALGRSKCILVAHDWGGSIAWVVASIMPNLVEKLVILNSPHPEAMAIKLRSFKQFLKSWYIFFFQLPYLPELCYRTGDLLVFDKLFGSSISEEELEGYKYTWSKPGAWTPPINYYRNILSASQILKPVKLPKIKVPSLIVWGENDLALEKDIPELCKPFVENLHIEYIQGASHFVHHDKPQEVNQIIEQFLF